MAAEVHRRVVMVGMFQPHHGRHHELGTEALRKPAQRTHAGTDADRRHGFAHIAQARFPEPCIALLARGNAVIDLTQSRIGRHFSQWPRTQMVTRSCRA